MERQHVSSVGSAGDGSGKPLKLGILYMDSESNRRWALRFNDPKELEQIDAVFVTVEPQGGSQKPTGKYFLYALLRKEANRPSRPSQILPRAMQSESVW
jgi:hypothetical protein